MANTNFKHTDPKKILLYLRSHCLYLLWTLMRFYKQATSQH